MANVGPNSNTSQFHVTFGPCSDLNGKSCVFGKIIEGWDVLDKMEKAVDKVCMIDDCGEIPEIN